MGSRIHEGAPEIWIRDTSTRRRALILTGRLRRGEGRKLGDLSARAATRLLHAVPEKAADEAPGDLWRLAYPVPFVQVLREVVDEEGTTDLLLLALIRQESFFDPLAGSPAGALGLAQVIPPTGRGIAEDLGVTDFDE